MIGALGHDQERNWRTFGEISKDLSGSTHLVFRRSRTHTRLRLTEVAGVAAAFQRGLKRAGKFIP